MPQKRRRRGPGEGTMYDRGGRWVGQLSVGRDPTGRPIRQTVYGATQAEVLEKLDRLRGELRMGRLPARASQMTLAEWIEHWLETRVQPHVAPNTFRTYAALLRNHLVPVLGGVRLQNLRREHFEAFFARWATRRGHEHR